MHGARFIGSEIYRQSRYGSRHPLSIPRISTVMDLCRALGWLSDESYIDSPRADVDALARFHDREYLAALRRAEAEGALPPDLRARFNIGANGNPIFPEVFTRPATAVGAGQLAARMLAEGEAAIIYSPAGGTHHGRPSQASGFCYLNEPVLTILALLDRGVGRVLYVDIDAHHADGVQDALSADPRVLLVSVHEDGRWPYSGAAEDRGGGGMRNLPVPPDFNDSEMRFLIAEAILPLAHGFAPDVVLLQCGADALHDDPLSKLALSNNALWHAVDALKGMGRPLLVTGGGGYNPWSVGRAWTGVWARLADRPIPDRLPDSAERILRGLTWQRSQGRNPPERWMTTLRDPPRDGAVRPRVEAVARAALAP
ncbi:MAG: acetoin utilization protein AcuC [Alphaproteobacteria bacterium]|nr:acetoin utilization protein AcuC [Alphaproteobacteria bacterium]